MLSPIWTIAVSIGLPCAFTGFCFWLLKRQINLRDTKNAEVRKQRQEEIDHKSDIQEGLLLSLITSVNASIVLGEATAKAVQRIPDAHCNGDMSEALEYASKVKHKQRDFINKEITHHVFNKMFEEME